LTSVVFKNQNPITYASHSPWFTDCPSLIHIYVPYSREQAYIDKWTEDGVTQDILDKIVESDREAMMSDLNELDNKYVKLNPDSNEQEQSLTGFITIYDPSNQEQQPITSLGASGISMSLNDGQFTADLSVDGMYLYNDDNVANADYTVDGIILGNSNQYTAELNSSSLTFIQVKENLYPYTTYSFTGIIVDETELLFPKKEDGGTFTLATTEDIESALGDINSVLEAILGV
jgi:hypothetical protein